MAPPADCAAAELVSGGDMPSPHASFGSEHKPSICLVRASDATSIPSLGRLCVVRSAPTRQSEHAGWTNHSASPDGRDLLCTRPSRPTSTHGAHSSDHPSTRSLRISSGDRVGRGVRCGCLWRMLARVRVRPRMYVRYLCHVYVSVDLFCVKDRSQSSLRGRVRDPCSAAGFFTR